MNLKSRILNNKAAALLLGAALLAGPVALAGQGRGSHGEGRGHGGRFLGRAMAALDLTEQQREKVQDIHRSARPAMEALREQIRTDARALREAASAPNPDKAAVGEAFLRVRADREAMRDKRREIHEEVLSVLTPEQRAKLEGFREGRRGQRFGRHMQGRRGGPDRD